MRQREPSASRAYSVATEAIESDCCNGTRVLESKYKVHSIISSPHKPSGLSLIRSVTVQRNKAQANGCHPCSRGIPHGTSWRDECWSQDWQQC